jgi:hypothetical protein
MKPGLSFIEVDHDVLAEVANLWEAPVSEVLPDRPESTAPQVAGPSGQNLDIHFEGDVVWHW